MTLISGMRGTKLFASVALDLLLPSQRDIKFFILCITEYSKHTIIASCTELVGKV